MDGSSQSPLVLGSTPGQSWISLQYIKSRVNLVSSRLGVQKGENQPEIHHFSTKLVLKTPQNPYFCVPFGGKKVFPFSSVG